MPPALDQRSLGSLHLPAELADRIRRHALRVYPAEACGFLLGSADAARAAVTDVRPERNRAATNDRFLIDASDVFQALQAAQRDGVELLGAYHSHPDGGDEPSATDRSEAWGEWLHLIVACEARKVGPMGCWIERGGKWKRVPIEGGTT